MQLTIQSPSLLSCRKKRLHIVPLMYHGGIGAICIGQHWAAAMSTPMSILFHLIIYFKSFVLAGHLKVLRSLLGSFLIHGTDSDNLEIRQPKFHMAFSQTYLISTELSFQDIDF
jgi:hypothetical protein